MRESTKASIYHKSCSAEPNHRNFIRANSSAAVQRVLSCDHSWLTKHWALWYFTRRPASADRTACRQFQATGQPVSRTQASNTMTSRLLRYEAKCVKPGASNAGRSLCVQISRERSYLRPIYWYHSKGNWLRYNHAADNFYIMKLCSRLLVLYCRNCPKDANLGNLSPFWGS